MGVFEIRGYLFFNCKNCNCKKLLVYFVVDFFSMRPLRPFLLRIVRAVR